MTQIGSAIQQRAQSVAGYHCNVQGVTMCNRSLKRTAISLSSCEAEFYAASACAGKLLGLAETLQGAALQLSSSSRDGFRFGTFYSAEDQADSSISKYDAWQHNSGYEKNVCREDNTQISSRNIWMDRERSRSQGNLDHESWKVRMVTTESFRTAFPVEQVCEYSQLYQLTECTLHRH